MPVMDHENPLLLAYYGFLDTGFTHFLDSH